MRTLRRGWPVHILAITAYFLLALLLTWPLAAHFGTHVPGNGGDDPPLTWNLWWVSHSLLTLKTSPFQSNILFYPLGINLAFYTLTLLNGMLSIPLQAVAGLVPASNILLLSSFVLSGYGMFLLVTVLLHGKAGRLEEWKIGASQPSNLPFFQASNVPAFIAGLIYAFASSKLFYAALGQWNIASSQWIPFYALCLVKIEREPRRWRYAILAGLFLLFQSYAEMTFGSFLVLFTVLWAAWPRDRRRWRPLLRPSLVIAAVFVAGLAPMLAAMIPDMRAEGNVLSAGGGFADVFSADLLGFLVPTMNHPLFGSLVERFHFDHTVGQHLYPGYLVLALAVLGAAWGWRKEQTRGVRFWTASALLFWLLTLGPALRVDGRETSIPLPFALLARLPFFEGNRYPSRYSVMLMLSLAVLAGWGLAAVQGWAGRRRPAMAWLVPAILAPLVLFEHLSVPLPLSDMRVPPAYEAIASLPGQATLLDVPVAWRNGARITGPLDPIIMFEEYYQTAHGKPLLGGNTSRNPPLKFQYFTEAPVINTLIALETGHVVDPAVVEQDRRLAPQVLRFLNVGAVVVHSDHVGPGTVEYIESVLPVRRIEPAADPTAQAYVVELAPWPDTWTATPDEPAGRLSYAEGWGALGGGVAWVQRKTARLLVPSDGAGQQMAFRAYAPGAGQHASVTIGGKTAGEVEMAAGWHDYAIELPPGVLREGLNEVWLRFDRLYPATTAGPSPRAIGTTGVESPVNLVVESAGEEIGDFAHIYVNGHDAAPGDRGYNAVVIDPATGMVEQAAAFDTHLDSGASQALAAFIRAVPAGRVVAVAAADEASRLLGAEAVAALGSIGAAGDLRDKFRWSHAIIGVKGAAPGTALEAMDGIRPVRVTAGEPVTAPQVAAAFGPIVFK